MSLVIPSGFGQAVYRYTCAGDPEEIVVTLGHDLEGKSSDQEAVDHLDQTWKASMEDQAPSVYTLVGTTLYIGNGAGNPSNVAISTNPPVTGGGTGTPLPTNCALLVRKQTNLAGRRGKGRFYLPPPSDGLTNAVGVIDGATVTALQGFLDLWYDNLRLPWDIGTTAFPGAFILHATGDSTLPPPTPVAAFVVQGTIATQRQRLRK